MKKTLSKNNMYKYKLSKELKNYIKSNKIWLFAYHISEYDFNILKDIQFDNCYVYKYKEYFYSLKDTKISYYINFINKRIYKDFYSLNKDFWKLRYSYYFYKLKDFNKEKRYYDDNNYFIDYTYNNKLYKEYFNK
jgi:hypothetical protein